MDERMGAVHEVISAEKRSKSRGAANRFTIAPGDHDPPACGDWLLKVFENRCTEMQKSNHTIHSGR